MKSEHAYPIYYFNQRAAESKKSKYRIAVDWLLQNEFIPTYDENTDIYIYG